MLNCIATKPDARKILFQLWKGGEVGMTVKEAVKHLENLNRIYGHMIRRCYDAGSEQYERYGARGISVCGEWRESFDTFADWAYKNGYAHGLTIDRIDNSKGYSPENCRWVTIAEQQSNKTNNIVFSVDGERKTASQVAREAGVKPATVYQWLRRGMSKEDVLNRLNAI